MQEELERRKGRVRSLQRGSRWAGGRCCSPSRLPGLARCCSRGTLRHPLRTRPLTSQRQGRAAIKSAHTTHRYCCTAVVYRGITQIDAQLEKCAGLCMRPVHICRSLLEEGLCMLWNDCMLVEGAMPCLEIMMELAHFCSHTCSCFVCTWQA